MPLGADRVISFRQSGTDESKGPLLAIIEPISFQEQAKGFFLGSTHTVTWDDEVEFTDGSTPGSGDIVVSDYFTGGEAPLQRARRWTWPTPLATALVKEAES